MVRVLPRFPLLITTTWVILLAPLSQDLLADGKALKNVEKVYTNGWAVKIQGGLESAKRLARQHGFDNVQPIGSLEGYYHLEHTAHPQRSRRSADDRTQQLKQDPKVLWAEQQEEKLRFKRGHYHDRMMARGLVPRFKDPLWDAQWYLDDKRKDLDLDIHVLPVWNKGISGKGVVVTILDDGIEHNHTDLLRNYDPNASWDVNGGDSDPFPRYDPTNENKHGTRCAGEVAGEANNTKCGVGVAYNAKIGGVRMLDGRVTDKVEAESLSLNPQYIDIYSASWGPSDDGATVEGPGTLALAAFENGIKNGRGGLGSIFVWASGNGGRHGDSCNCDGYTDSIYTLSISSASDHGESPWYSESCSSTLASTFSSGAHGEQRIVTTDLHNECTERHTGTSASAPLAAGIIALALEINPRLTWRDIQHIVVWTSNWLPLKHDQDWNNNGVGLTVNRKFGYGLLMADKIVEMADPKTFKRSPEKKICRGQINQDVRPVKWNEPLNVTLHSTGCVGTNDEVLYIEHVQMLVSMEYTRRGDLVVYLTSPMGTKSCLLSPRKEDISNEGFTKWPFMTTHNWGEDPRGVWTLEIKDLGDNRGSHGTLTEWQLILHGTKEKPNHQNVEHPVKPRDSVPVPVSTLTFTPSTQVPSGPTYTFGPSPQTQASIPHANIPAQTATAAAVQRPAGSYGPSRVEPQTPNRLNQFAPINRGPLGPQLQQNTYAPAQSRTYQPAANYMAQQAPNYYGYQARPPQYNKPQVQNDGRLNYRPLGWPNMPLDYNNAARYAAYNYYRTFGRRGLLAKSPRHHVTARRNKLRAKWKSKGS